MSDIQVAIQAILGNDNQKRKEAEQYLDNEKDTNPGSLIQNLFEAMRN